MIKIIKSEITRTETMFEAIYTFENGMKIVITQPCDLLEVSKKENQDFDFNNLISKKVSEREQ